MMRRCALLLVSFLAGCAQILEVEEFSSNETDAAIPDGMQPARPMDAEPMAGCIPGRAYKTGAPCELGETPCVDGDEVGVAVVRLSSHPAHDVLALTQIIGSRRCRRSTFRRRSGAFPAREDILPRIGSPPEVQIAQVSPTSGRLAGSGHVGHSTPANEGPQQFPNTLQLYSTPNTLNQRVADHSAGLRPCTRRVTDAAVRALKLLS